MDFKHPIQTLNDLHAGRDLGRFQGHVRDAIDLHARRNLDEERGLSGDRQETLRDRGKERRHLWLQAIEENI